MQIHTCKKGCCSIRIHEYYTIETTRQHYRNNKKAGVFIYDPKKNRVLLVQSRGKFWGPPKGTIEFGENEIDCAIREVMEETGLYVNPTKFSRATAIKNKAVYFYLEMDTIPVNIQTNIDDNDANGITWIKLDCLQECIKNGHILLNKHCKIVFNRFLDQIFPISGFTKVFSKRKPRRRRK